MGGLPGLRSGNGARLARAPSPIRLQRRRRPARPSLLGDDLPSNRPPTGRLEPGHVQALAVLAERAHAGSLPDVVDLDVVPLRAAVVAVIDTDTRLGRVDGGYDRHCSSPWALWPV